MCCSPGGWGPGKLLGPFRLEKRLKKLRKWFIVDTVIEKEGQTQNVKFRFTPSSYRLIDRSKDTLSMIKRRCLIL